MNKAVRYNINKNINILIACDFDRLNQDGHYFLKKIENTPFTKDNYKQLSESINNLDLVSYDRVSNDGKKALDALCKIFNIQ